MSNDNSLITAITTYNEDWIINKTLDIVSKFSDLIIVYDDGSIDRTEEIARSYEKVKWYVRKKKDMSRRLEAQQRLELLNIVKKYNPEYLMLLDADEIPTKSVFNFLNNIKNSIYKSWKVRVINLWFSEKYYRVDSYTTKFNTQVNWNPFHKKLKPLTKCPLFKFDIHKQYYYDLNVDWGGCSRYHPAPENIDGDVLLTDDFCILHYGWLKNTARTNKIKKIVEYNLAANSTFNYDNRMEWHQSHSQDAKSIFMPAKEDWFW
jgi:glycosyltransferase involved in cell wall biosynthesis